MIAHHQLKNAVDQAAASPQFGTAAWLTFYLSGSERDLTELAADLSELGAENLSGAEGGFIYAKVPVEIKSLSIEAVAGQVSRLAEQHNVLVDHIDLDSSTEVTSQFFCLTGAHR